ncbi:hypothetical protein K7432_002544 [Basidiobolus ranarum]
MHGKDFLGSTLRVELAHTSRDPHVVKTDAFKNSNQIQTEVGSQNENLRREPQTSRVDSNRDYVNNRDESRHIRPAKDKDPCFNCGGIGHWVRDCPSAPRGTRDETRPKRDISREPRAVSRGEDHRRYNSPSRERNYDSRRQERESRPPGRYDRYLPSQAQIRPAHDHLRRDTYPDRYERPTDLSYSKDHRSYSRPNYQDSERGYPDREYRPVYPPSERDLYYDRDDNYFRERYEREQILGERDRYGSFSRPPRPTSRSRFSPPHYSQRSEFNRDYQPAQRPRTPPKLRDTHYEGVRDYDRGRERRDHPKDDRRRSRSPPNRRPRAPQNLDNGERGHSNRHPQIPKGPRTPSPQRH